jgi:alpha-mannosidase
VLQAIAWIERGPLRQRLRVVRSLAGSTFQQDYCLEISAQLLKIVTTVDWQASHTLVKASFPLTWQAEDATYEIPFGSIRRATHPRTSQDAAKWEVPALCWADISESGYGLSLLTDSKHGFDAQPNQLRLTLLKAAQWPDPQADRGTHCFTLALYPHPQTSAIAGSTHYARALNIPCLTWVGMDTNCPPGLGKLPESHAFLNLATDDHLGSLPPILSAFKPAESNPDQWILRCYETQGETHSFTLYTALPLEVESVVNILEENQQEHDLLEKNSPAGNLPEKNSQPKQTPADIDPTDAPPQAITLHSWQVLTLKLRDRRNDHESS